jgi:hypothetical protein
VRHAAAGRIVINPADLRRGATQLLDRRSQIHALAAQLAGAAVPALPSDLLGGIESGIHAAAAQLRLVGPPLEEGALELKARALWADIADELAAGYPLSGTQLNEFMSLLHTGALVRYAEPWQAELAGSFVAKMYEDDYKQPDKLLELARILRENEGFADENAAFMAGFVDRFGTRIDDVPRVIQAMDWTPGTSLGASDDPMVDWDLGRELWQDGYELKVDPVELLGAFSMALALGTASGRVSQQVEHDIAWDDDRWAVAQLLHEGRFGANFLKEAFQSVVVSDIQRDAVRMGPDLTGYMAIGLGDGHGPSISTDERQLVLSALERNPEGAALALSTQLPEEVHIASRWGHVETRDPVAVLYAADWNDDGKQLAHLYSEATGWAQSQVAEPGTSVEGNKITLQLIERVSNAQRDDLGVVTDALARDLAAHHIPALIEMGADSGQFDADTPVGKGFVDLTSHQIMLDGRQVEQLVNAMADRDPADKVFVEALGKGQAHFLAEMVREHPDKAESWGYKVGTLNQYVLNAHDVGRTIEFGEASDRQKLGISVLSSTLSALTAGTPYGALVGPGTTLIDIGTGPSALDLETHNLAEKLDARGTVRALIATAAHEYGHAPDPPPDQAKYLLHQGHLVAYTGDLPREVRHEFDQWVLEVEADDSVVGSAIDNATQGMDDHARH